MLAQTLFFVVVVVVVNTDVSILVPLYDLTQRGVAGLPVEASQILDHCQHVHIWRKKTKKQQVPSGIIHAFAEV